MAAHGLKAGVRREVAKGRAAEELIGQARSLKPQLAALKRSAQRYHRLLSPEVSAAEIEVLSTPEANLLGVLEILVNSEIEPVVRKLDEVEALMVPSPRSARKVRRRKQKAKPRRRTGTRG
jgi:hypothetical protein